MDNFLQPLLCSSKLSHIIESLEKFTRSSGPARSSIVQRALAASLPTSTYEGTFIRAYWRRSHYNAPKGFRVLDPTSTPSELLEEIKIVPEENIADNVDSITKEANCEEMISYMRQLGGAKEGLRSSLGVDVGSSTARATSTSGFFAIHENFVEEHNVTVISLVKVVGFKMVPSYVLTGEEATNAPKDCRVLDPTATPSELLKVIKIVQKENIVNNVDNITKEANCEEMVSDMRQLGEQMRG
ncbi:hypothetical protein TSUD_302740 [Trifolium subterraneum]|uniref:Uncharacterized protein n=1 Tax=Trifolium subterraneum TaxID=3900 RepID=A0A2Z6NVC3_TRISU|nr:hypothetical protein TSUD_302740 [Trifolium subterraneum]